MLRAHGGGGGAPRRAARSCRHSATADLPSTCTHDPGEHEEIHGGRLWWPRNVMIIMVMITVFFDGSVTFYARYGADYSAGYA